MAVVALNRVFDAVQVGGRIHVKILKGAGEFDPTCDFGFSEDLYTGEISLSIKTRAGRWFSEVVAESGALHNFKAYEFRDKIRAMAWKYAPGPMQRAEEKLKRQEWAAKLRRVNSPRFKGKDT